MWYDREEIEQQTAEIEAFNQEQGIYGDGAWQKKSHPSRPSHRRRRICLK